MRGGGGRRVAGRGSRVYRDLPVTSEAAMEYRLVSADSHLSLPPGFFRRYLPARHRDHPWVAMVEGAQKQALKMAGMGLAHMAGRAFEEYQEKDISADDIRRGAYDPDARLADMDLDQVDAEVLITGGAAPTGEGVDVEFQRAVLRSYNDSLSGFCSTNPARLIGPATVPFQNMDLALEEMQRASTLPGIRAFLFEAFPERPYWDDAYEPLWQVANDLGYPIHVHIGQPRSNAFTMGSLTPNKQGTAMSFISLAPTGLMETMASIIFAGIPQRYENVRFVFTEAGASWLPYFKERMDVVFRRHRFWTESELTEPPSFYVERQCLNTFIEDTAAIRLRHEVGMSNMMWSTDYPHSDSTWPHSQKYIEEAFAGVPEDERNQLKAGNAVELYRL
jgi:predicted TIM-barrel fold metal-dependent hydrolase